MDRFDYVIVGGGSAGCVLAHRLSAEPSVLDDIQFSAVEWHTDLDNFR